MQRSQIREASMLSSIDATGAATPLASSSGAIAGSVRETVEVVWRAMPKIQDSRLERPSYRSIERYPEERRPGRRPRPRSGRRADGARIRTHGDARAVQLGVGLLDHPPAVESRAHPGEPHDEMAKRFGRSESANLPVSIVTPPPGPLAKSRVSRTAVAHSPQTRATSTATGIPSVGLVDWERRRSSGISRLSAGAA